MEELHKVYNEFLSHNNFDGNIDSLLQLNEKGTKRDIHSQRLGKIKGF